MKKKLVETILNYSNGKYDNVNFQKNAKIEAEKRRASLSANKNK